MQTPETRPITYATTPAMDTIVAPDDYGLPPTSFKVWEQMVLIKPVPSTSNHHNRNKIVYLINTTPHLHLVSHIYRTTNTVNSNSQAPNPDA